LATGSIGLAVGKGTITVLDLLGNLKRTHYCGELRPGMSIRRHRHGRVHRRRDLGNLLFLDLRDRSGIVQIVSTRRPTPKRTPKRNMCAASSSSLWKARCPARENQSGNRHW